MIDLEKSKIEAEALAKLRKEQYFREVLAGELGVMIDKHFASKEPLREVIPKFVKEIKNLVIAAKNIFDYLEGVRTEQWHEVAKEEFEPEPDDEKKLAKMFEAMTPNTATEKALTPEEPSTATEPSEEAPSRRTHATQIAKVTGMKPNTVVHRIAYNKDKIDRKQGVEKPEAKPRTITADLISDEELEEQYFKRGKTIKEIADNLKIKPYGLYKRIEAMRDKRHDIAKECASSK